MCLSGENITAFGLLLDIVGAILLWHYVAEINFADKEEYLKGNALLELKDPTQEEINAFKKKILFTRVGIALLVIGFTLQLIGNYVS